VEIAGADNLPAELSDDRGAGRPGSAGPAVPREKSTVHDRDVTYWPCRHCVARFRTKQSLTVHLLKVHITLGPRERALSVDAARRVGVDALA
jgi:hypothetical protein